MIYKHIFIEICFGTIHSLYTTIINFLIKVLKQFANVITVRRCKNSLSRSSEALSVTEFYSWGRMLCPTSMLTAKGPTNTVPVTIHVCSSLTEVFTCAACQGELIGCRLGPAYVMINHSPVKCNCL